VRRSGLLWRWSGNELRSQEGRLAGRAAMVVLAAGMALTLGLALCAAALGRAKSSSHSAPRGAVTVRRDKAGIPHIVATNFTALGLGEAMRSPRTTSARLPTTS
jgi:hypothetical protein